MTLCQICGWVSSSLSMEYSLPISVLFWLFIGHTSSQSASLNLSISSAVVKFGDSFNITVDFHPSTYDGGFDALKCGYETGSSAFADFVEYSLYRKTFELISSGFQDAYAGRLIIPSPKIITISNVKFDDERSKYHCRFTYFLRGSGAGVKVLNSNKASLTTVYSLPVFGSNSLSTISDVIKGRNNSIYCRVTSRPASTITFTYESGINAVQGHSSSADGDYMNTVGILTIINADLSLNRKTVSCTGTPVYGRGISNQTTLNVLYKPENVILTASNTNPMNGANITLNCSSAAIPAAKYRFFWLKNSVMTEIPSNGSGSILISDINYVDFGGFHVTYRCVPHNMVGSGPSADVQLLIQGTTSKPVYTEFKSTTKTAKETTTRRTDIKETTTRGTDIKDFSKAASSDSSKTWIHLGYNIVIIWLLW